MPNAHPWLWSGRLFRALAFREAGMIPCPVRRPSEHISAIPARPSRAGQTHRRSPVNDDRPVWLPLRHRAIDLDLIPNRVQRLGSGGADLRPRHRPLHDGVPQVKHLLRPGGTPLADAAWRPGPRRLRLAGTSTISRCGWVRWVGGRTAWWRSPKPSTSAAGWPASGLGYTKPNSTNHCACWPGYKTPETTRHRDNDQTPGVVRITRAHRQMSASGLSR